MNKILIIQSIFYKEISKMLLEATIEELQNQEEVEYEIINVPGALEIPATIAMANETNKYDGFIALGCVIKGQTTHYDYVCQESARGLNDLAINHKLAIANGILTVENEEQGLERADKNKRNKGGFVAKACIEMIKIKKRFKL